MIIGKVKQRAVLGSRRDMTRTDYAVSPILRSLKDFAQPRCVNVAYVPNSMGKTTACLAFMKKYVKEGTNRGICFSPQTQDAAFKPFVEHMVTLLGFTDVNHPPAGMLTFLLEALLGEQKKGRPSFLFLDDFMPLGPTDVDVGLLVTIKTMIKSKNIIVVVF